MAGQEGLVKSETAGTTAAQRLEQDGLVKSEAAADTTAAQLPGQDGLVRSGPLPRASLQRPWWARWERKLLVSWYGVTGWLFAPGWAMRTLPLVPSFALLAYPIWKLGWAYGAVGTVIWVVTALVKIRTNLAPRHLQLVKEKRVERQLLLYRLVEKLQHLLRVPEQMGPDRLHEYQVEVLQLIVSYVRSHRSDERGTTIFANLMADVNGEWMVLARDQRHRLDSPVVPREHSLAWQAYTTAEYKVTGDVYADYPGSPPGRPYRSILAIPVFLGGIRPLGVVTIDSSRKYHFDSDLDNLVLDLNPFVAMLGSTLEPLKARRAPQLQSGQGRKKKRGRRPK